MSDEFPGNTHVLERLKLLLASGEGIAVVGAGASAGLYPLWNELITMLANEAVENEKASPEDRDYWLKESAKAQQVVHRIKKTLGDSLYGNALRTIFRPKVGAGGSRFTRTHAAVVGLPLRGILTTNYDPGLLEARLSVRPEVGATGFSTWRDVDAVGRWYTGDIFKETSLPILFAHGYYERSDTIVLGAEEYDHAYAPGPYRRLFEKLWSQDKLIFIGFGFSDRWLDYIVKNVLAETSGRFAGKPRHIAVIGLPQSAAYTREMREMFAEQYGASVYFYRIKTMPDGSSDHGELQRLLEELTEKKKRP